MLDKLVGQSLAGDETRQLHRRDLLNPAQIRQLIGERVVGAIEPEAPAPALPRAAMHSRWGPDGVPEFALSQLVLSGKDFEPLGQPRPLDREPQFNAV